MGVSYLTDERAGIFIQSLVKTTPKRVNSPTVFSTTQAKSSVPLGKYMEVPGVGSEALMHKGKGVTGERYQGYFATIFGHYLFFALHFHSMTMASYVDLSPRSS